MEIQSGIDGLKTLLGVSQAASTNTQAVKRGPDTAGAPVSGDDATLSAAGTEVSIAVSAPEVRMDKVAAVQAALAAGTYDVPASAVASKMVDAMLGGGR